MPYKYFLSARIGEEVIEREVSVEEYCKAERMQQMLSLNCGSLWRQTKYIIGIISTIV